MAKKQERIGLEFPTHHGRGVAYVDPREVAAIAEKGDREGGIDAKATILMLKSGAYVIVDCDTRTAAMMVFGR